jgi:hypothetical protein
MPDIDADAIIIAIIDITPFSLFHSIDYYYYADYDY